MHKVTLKLRFIASEFKFAEATAYLRRRPINAFRDI